MDIKNLIEENIKKAVKNLYNKSLSYVLVEHPENEEFGDYSTNVALVISKDLGKKPMDVAEEIVHELNSFDTAFTPNCDSKERENKEENSKKDEKYTMFSRIHNVSPGFINIQLSHSWLNNLLFSSVTEKEKYTKENLGDMKTLLVEYSQPNPNKPMHIGHTRNNFLGSSLSSIFRYLGYNVIEANYMNDWGTHICKSMLMYKKYKEGEKPNKKPDHFVGDLYVMYEVEEEKNPAIKEELAEMFRKLESGDEKTLELWKKITTWVYEGWEQTYKDEGIHFDDWLYQHDYKDSGKEIVKTAIEKGIAEKDETGAVIARLEKFGIPDKVLLRSDGTSVYSTQDLQLAKDSYEKFKFDKRLYVVDYRQSDYFKQIFKILEIFGFSWADKLFHVAYGTVELPEGKMSSRKGIIVSADEVFKKIKEEEEKEIEKSIKDVKNKEETVNKVSLAAFKYGMLKVDPKKNVVFRLDEVTKFEGNTGPYLLYTYARANSILDKINADIESIKMGLQDIIDYKPSDKELDILRILYRFNEVIKESGDLFAPNVVANYLYDLAQRFNSFYSSTSIMKTKDEKEKDYKILLTYATANILNKGLSLLGIEVVKRM